MTAHELGRSFLARLARERDEHLATGERFAQLALHVEEPSVLLRESQAALERSERIQDELRGWIDLALGVRP